MKIHIEAPRTSPRCTMSTAMLASGRRSASYDWGSMSHAEVKRYWPSERAAAKQAARDEQARAFASGERSAAQLHRENGLLAFSRQGIAVDFPGFIDSQQR